MAPGGKFKSRSATPGRRAANGTLSRPQRTPIGVGSIGARRDLLFVTAPDIDRPQPRTAIAARTTSVGSLAIDRFLRPVSYQDVPDALLPAALRAANPLGLPRRIDGAPERA